MRYLITSFLLLCTLTTSAAAFNVMAMFGSPENYVKPSVRWAPDRCGVELPLLVSVVNDSNETVFSFRFHVIGRLQGHSDYIYVYFEPVRSDMIVEPTHEIELCTEVPGSQVWGNEYIQRKFQEKLGNFPPAEMVWEVKSFTPIFE
ncbi:hypothetical protein OE699_02080 [Sedimentimonas flavescens]|uniref:Uncharacterized protein n=1 Tax=Sedimentimonas flavescens TaxID=2851012 RepID=A0ABT2ZV52_9RHOB|nr:hypothetical protein [Sedimentimonas flavescens]MCV2877628.1 hypothetical protein [Sedimentimonas flavescens]